MMGFGLEMGLIGFFWMLLFWGGLIALAVWLIGLLFPVAKSQSDDKTGSPLSAQEILNRRYAQGELTAEQYQEMVRTIRR